MVKRLRFTTHARERLEERFGISIQKARYLFNHSILIGEQKDTELHEKDGIIFVVSKDLLNRYLLITIYEKMKYNPELDPNYIESLKF